MSMYKLYKKQHLTDFFCRNVTIDKEKCPALSDGAKKSFQTTKKSMQKNCNSEPIQTKMWKIECIYLFFFPIP